MLISGIFQPSWTMDIWKCRFWKTKLQTVWHLYSQCFFSLAALCKMVDKGNSVFSCDHTYIFWTLEIAGSLLDSDLISKIQRQKSHCFTKQLINISKKEQTGVY